MNVLEYLKENILYLDGGMGTLLQAKGLTAGEHPEKWNLTHADDVTAIHRAYYDAGSNVVSANTFGANALKFESERVVELRKLKELVLLAGTAIEKNDAASTDVAMLKYVYEKSLPMSADGSDATTEQIKAACNELSEAYALYLATAVK